jgi:hypothetical protein
MESSKENAESGPCTGIAAAFSGLSPVDRARLAAMLLGQQVQKERN